LSECLYGLSFAFVLSFARGLLHSALFFLPSHALGFGPVHALLFNGCGYLFARDEHLARQVSSLRRFPSLHERLMLGYSQDST
jgi:hypothetical protein